MGSSAGLKGMKACRKAILQASGVGCRAISIGHVQDIVGKPPGELGEEEDSFFPAGQVLAGKDDGIAREIVALRLAKPVFAPDAGCRGFLVADGSGGDNIIEKANLCGSETQIRILVIEEIDRIE